MIKLLFSVSPDLKHEAQFSKDGQNMEINIKYSETKRIFSFKPLLTQSNLKILKQKSCPKN